jgi:citrate lyase gamma subunit
MAFSQIVDEVVAQFTSRPSATVTIKIEINAVDKKGFDENLQRAVRENSALLKIEPAEFETE